jgi:uncharacterized membrane protein
MEHTGNPEHGHGHGEITATQSFFPEEEWQEFRAQDLAAAKYIVGLMLGIFTLGLLLYGGVALWVEARVV